MLALTEYFPTVFLFVLFCFLVYEADNRRNSVLTPSLSVLCRAAQRAEGTRTQGPQSQGKRRGRRRRVRRPGIGLEVWGGLRQGPVQDETQPQAHQQPEHRLEQRAAGHEAQHLIRAEVFTSAPSAHPWPLPPGRPDTHIPSHPPPFPPSSSSRPHGHTRHI